MSRSTQKNNKEQLIANATNITPFSQLTYLLHMITLLNADYDLQSSFEPGGISYNDDATSDSDSVGLAPLEAMAAILVQDHEVVAACYTSDRVSIVASTTNLNAFPATDVDDGVDVDRPSSLDKLHCLQLAAHANPDFAHPGRLDTNNLHNLQIEIKGEDLWRDVQDSERGWHYAFM
jgi:hypothetical protein